MISINTMPTSSVRDEGDNRERERRRAQVKLAHRHRLQQALQERGVHEALTKHQDELAHFRAQKDKFEGDSETYLRASQIMDKFGGALQTSFTSSGRLGGANFALTADMLRAEAQLDGAFMTVLESEGRSFDSFAQMLRQAMTDAVAQFKEILMSQAQLAEHLGQTV